MSGTPTVGCVLRVGEYEVLPQPLAVLAGEFRSDCVDAPEAFHADQEGFVVIEAGGEQVGDLLAQVTLEFVDVVDLDRGAASDRCPPFADPGIDAVHGHASLSFHTPPSVRVAAAHWRRCSSSASAPAVVSS